jgi:hypothetical protein
MKQPGCDRGDDNLFREKFGEVEIRLEDTRATPVLEPRLCFPDDAGYQRGDGKHQDEVRK